MHVLFQGLFLLIFLCADHLGGQITSCYEHINVKNHVELKQFQYVTLQCLLRIKPDCRKGPINMSWTTKGKVIKNRTKRNTPRNIKWEMLLPNLQMDDSGDFECFISNDAFQFSHAISLTVQKPTEFLASIGPNIAPRSSHQIQSVRTYWNPRMANINRFHEITRPRKLTISCFFYSKMPFNGSANWYGRRVDLPESQCGPGELIVQNSPYLTSITNDDCSHDFETGTPGYCYWMALEIPDAISHSNHQWFTCAIGDHLNLTHELIIRTNYHSNPTYQLIFPEQSIDFNVDSRICVGQTFRFSCSETNSTLRMVLIYNDGVCETILNESVGHVQYVISAEMRHNGSYTCRLLNYMEKSMVLFVNECHTIQWKLASIICMSLIVFILVLVPTTIYGRRIKQALRLRNSESVYVMKRLVLNEVIKNPDYISVQIDSQFEISRDRLTISGIKLGEGNFGVVFKGQLDSQDVAIKMAHVNSETILADEVRMMQQLGRHRHILALLGVCNNEGRLWAVMDLAAGGSLKIFLQDNNPIFKPLCKQLSIDQLLLFAAQISQGMEYLSSRSVVHRDLAARNILLAANGDVKISDFGLTRIVINYYQSSSSCTEDACPARWMAPECFILNRFTTKSDVWSFGIVLWELFSLGMTPYFSVEFGKVRNSICSGVINERPELAPVWVYELMKTCWRFDEDLRPQFITIVTQFGSMIDNEYV